MVQCPRDETEGASGAGTGMERWATTALLTVLQKEDRLLLHRAWPPLTTNDGASGRETADRGRATVCCSAGLGLAQSVCFIVDFSLLFFISIDWKAGVPSYKECSTALRKTPQ